MNYAEQFYGKVDEIHNNKNISFSPYSVHIRWEERESECWWILHLKLYKIIFGTIIKMVAKILRFETIYNWLDNIENKLPKWNPNKYIQIASSAKENDELWDEREFRKNKSKMEKKKIVFILILVK